MKVRFARSTRVYGRWRPSLLVLIAVGFVSLVALRTVESRRGTPPATPGPTPITPMVALNVPPKVLLNEKFTFTVTFDNTGNAPGYGPFIDLILPAGGIDLNNSGQPCDGIKSTGVAAMVGVTGGPFPITVNSTVAPCSTTGTTVPHMFAANGVAPVALPAGAELVTLELPFGSFQPGQPPITVQVTAFVHDFADVNKPLSIIARGGFRFGSDALNNSGSDPVIMSAGAIASTIPTVLLMSKTYSGPEGEAATGPNFSGYYPMAFSITVNIANGHKINNLNIKDCHPSGVVFGGVVAPTTPGYALSSTTPCLVMDYNGVVGTLLPEDIKITFSFYLGENGNNGKPLLNPKSCSNPVAKNTVGMVATWLPHDPRDAALGLVTIKDQQDATVTAKRLATQKTAAVKILGKKNEILDKPGGAVPGDYIEYSIKFQISDYFTMGELRLEDILGDAQLLAQSSPFGQPTLSVTDQFGTTNTSFNDSGTNQTLTIDKYIGLTCNGMPGVRMTFDISKAMMLAGSGNRHDLGILTGGHAFMPVSSVPATGVIVFYVKIQDQFQYINKPHEIVDKEDVMTNCVKLFGTVMENTNGKDPMRLGPTCDDDSSAGTSIAGDTLGKKIIGRNGKLLPPLPNPPQFAAAELITFSLSKTIPSGDWEDMTIQDWLPLPVLQSIPLTVLPNCGPAPGLPGKGDVCLGPNHNAGAPNSITVNPDNSVTFDFGSHDNPANTPVTIELRFSYAISTEPYADGLKLTNEAVECEKNSVGKQFCQTAAAQFIVTQPNLRIIKGVIATDNPASTFTSPPLFTNWSAQVLTSAGSPGGNRIWSGPIVSSNLLALNPNAFNSNLNDADAGDWITYAVVVENRGSGLNGAFDIQLSDQPVPLTGFVPSNQSGNLRAHNGAGTAHAFTPFTLNALVPGVLELDDPGPTPIDTGGLDRYSNVTAANGTNLTVLTYNRQLNTASNVPIGQCYDNTASIAHYANAEAGKDFVSAGFGGPLTDAARVCVTPTLTKSIVATSEPDTTPQTSAGGGVPNVTIGEIVRYRLLVRLPESTSPNLSLRDALPVGLRYMPGTAKIAFVANQAGITHPSLTGAGLNISGSELNIASITPTSALSSVTVGANCGDDPTFNLGSVTNSDSDPDREFIVLEFNALVCNQPSNTLGNPPIPNTFGLFSNGQQVGVNSPPVNVKIVEPNLQLSKTAEPPVVVAPAAVSFVVTNTNVGDATAYEVTLTDTLPSGLTLTGTPTVSVSPFGCASPSVTSGTANPIVVKIPRQPVGCTVTIKLIADYHGPCPFQLTNQASVKYSTLPGGENNIPVGTQPNATGSVTPCSTGLNGADCERVSQATASATVTINCPSTSACAPQPPGMEGWWPMNETGGIVAADIKGGHHGVLPMGTPAGPTFITGKVGGAYSFASNLGVTVLDSPALRFGATDFSIDAWIQVIPSPLIVQAVADKLDVPANRGYAFYVQGGYLNLVMGNGSTLVTYTSTTQIPTPSSTTWFHVAVSVHRATNGGSFYINGAPAGIFSPLPTSVDISNISPTPLLLGESRLNFASPLCLCHYALDEVEIFRGAVTQQSMNQVYLAGPSGKCP